MAVHLTKKRRISHREGATAERAETASGDVAADEWQIGDVGDRQLQGVSLVRTAQ